MTSILNLKAANKEPLTYRFSFTGANAMISEFIKVAELVNEGKSVEDIGNEVLGREKGETNRREFRELAHRIKSLTPKQIEILAEGNLDEQQQITHLALCKTYGIYKDFVAEVLAEKIKMFDNELTELDYNSFISKKKMEHPELEKLADSTQKKVKQVIYRMLQQVGIIDSMSNPSILSPVLGVRVHEAIKQDDPTLLQCFLVN